MDGKLFSQDSLLDGIKATPVWEAQSDDALFFNLYGIGRNTFPIVRERDEKVHGRYLTKDLIPAYMNAMAAGDSTAVVQV